MPLAADDTLGVSWVDIQSDDEGALLTVGEFYNVEITDVAEYDLFGTVGV